MDNALNNYLPALKDFFADGNLGISAPKSTPTILTTWTKKVYQGLDIHIRQSNPTNRNPNILGVTFDSLFLFCKNAEVVAKNVRDRNRILIALAGGKWGREKETILTTYKAIWRPPLTTKPQTGPRSSATRNGETSRPYQNTALRTTTGCHSKTPIEHLHQKTILLSLREHWKILTSHKAIGRPIV